jgi:Tol biopolymer transport system component
MRTQVTALAAAALLLSAGAVSPSWAATADSSPSPSARVSVPTGRIVASAVGPGYLVSMLPDGSDRRRIHPYPKGVKAGEIDVTDDGAVIAASFGQSLTKSQIYTVQSDGTEFKRVTQGVGGHGGPTFSPSGGGIAFARFADAASTLHQMQSDGSHVVQLTTGAEPSPDVEAYVPDSWSPDGQYIAFLSDSPQGRSIVLTDPAGSWFRFLRTFPHSRGNLFGLNWSPDSSTIIYSRGNRRNSGSDLWTVDRDGSNLTRITHTPKRYEDSPAYSPDGTAIVCSVSPISYNWADVVTMDADGSNRHRIVTPRAAEYFVAWGG